MAAMTPDAQPRRMRARIGVLVPFTNTNLEPDLAGLCPPDVSLHFTRIGGYNLEGIPDAGEMARMGEAGLDDALRLIAAVRPDVVLYGCTSATLVHGVDFDADFAARIGTKTGVRAFTAAGAIVQALRKLGIDRVALATPYEAEINARTARFLRSAGIETVNSAHPQQSLSSYDQGAMMPEQILDLAVRADHPKAEAIVLACTDLRALEARARVERALGKPVITSNLALFEAAMGALGVNPPG
jgi:maleate isomerase